MSFKINFNLSLEYYCTASVVYKLFVIVVLVVAVAVAVAVAVDFLL